MEKIKKTGKERESQRSEEEEVLPDLQRCVSSFRKLSFVQTVPSLEKLLYHCVFRIDYLEAANVCSAEKHLVQTDVGEALWKEMKEESGYI